jgi:trk system potassium uptake protein TrkA
MEYIVVGYGRVGQPTVENLDRSGHGVTVVETNEEKGRLIEERGYRVVQGDGASEAVLEEAYVASAGGLAALTGDLETNLTACEIANEAGCRTVLRVSQDVSPAEYERYAEMIDEIVYPERVGAAAAKTALLGGDFNVISALTEELSIASVTVPDGAPVVGERVVNIDLPGEARIYAHGRAGKDMSIPLPQARIEAGDSVAIMAESDRLPDVRAAIRGT